MISTVDTITWVKTMKTKLKLDTEQMLGFRLQDAEQKKHSKIGSKVGDKNFGPAIKSIRVGAKIGSKPGVKTN